MADAAFDPAEFASFKAQSAPKDGGGDPSGFDPSEYARFKASAAKPAGPAASFADRFGSGPMARDGQATGPLYDALQARADEKLIGSSGVGNQTEAAASAFSNTLGLNLPRNAAAGIATAAGALGVPGYSNKSFGENYQLAKDRDEALARQNPKSSIAGTVAGIGAGAALLPVAPAAEGAALSARIAAGAATGAGYGLVGELADSKDAYQAGKAAAIGGALGGVAVPVAEKAISALAPFFTKGVSTRNSAGQFTDEARAMLTRSGINPDTIDHKTERALLDAFEKGGVTDAAVREGRASAQGIDLTKGQATADYAQQQAEAMAARNGGNAGQKVLADRLNAQQEQIAARQRGIGDELAGEQPRIESPYDAGAAVAERARAAARNAEYRASESEGLANAAQSNLRTPVDPLVAADTVATRARGATDRAARAEREALQAGGTALAGARGEGDAIDAAGSVAQGVRDRAAAARERYQSAYQDVANTEGNFQPGSFDRAGSAIRERLGIEYPIDPVVTPSANRALGDLDNLRVNALTPDGALTPRAMTAIREAGLNPAEIQGALTARGTTEANARSLLDDLNVNLPRGLIGRHDPEGPSLRELDQVRKRLVSHYKGASPGSEDQRAIRQILREFDDHAERAMQSGLFSGDDAALERLQGARGAFRDFQQTFRPQGAGDDVGTAMRRIVERDARPDEVAGLLYGNVQSGNVGRSLRLADRLETTLGADSAEFGAMRRGLVSEIVNGRNMAPEAVSARIEQALTGDGRQLSQRLLTEDQTRGLRAYQQAVTRAAETRAAVPAWVNDLAAANFEPQRVAEKLYGSSLGGRASASQYADNLRSFFGANSPEWQMLGQGYVSHILGGAEMSADAIGKRVASALAPENRFFLQKMLTPDQVKGLEAVRQGVTTAKLTREGVPEWISDLAKGDFDPRRVVDKMLGAGAPGSNAAAAQYTSALKGFLGEASPEWSAIRQAAWQQLVNKPKDHIGDFGAQAQANRISEFLNARGRTLASVLYTPDELAKMREYGAVLKMLVPQRLAGGSASPNSDTAPASASLLKRLGANGNRIATMLGTAGALKGGPVGAVLGFGLGKGLTKAGEAIQSRAERRFAQEAISGAPRFTPPAPPPNTIANQPLAIGAGLYAQ